MASIGRGTNPFRNGTANLKPGYLASGPASVDISDLKPTDTLIAVMGMTGAGKSTFISHCTDVVVPIGHNMTSCTQEVLVYPYRSVENRRVYLVDTPGFDDTDRTDTQVLKEIATWLTDTFNEQVRLSGLIYLHRISDIRMQGSAKRNLFMFKKLCGPAAFKKVRLATTMWEDHERNGEAREQELINTHDFWGYMIDQGAKTYRHMNTRASALKLVDLFLDPADAEVEKLVLNIQAEMQNGSSLEDTSAGREVDIQLQELRERYLQELEAIKSEQKEAFATRDRDSAKALQEMQLEYDKKIENVNRSREQLRVDMERLHQEHVKKLIERIQEQEEYVKKMKQQLEVASNEEKILLREQMETVKEANSQLQKQVASITQRIKRRAAVQTHGTYGTNQMKYGCSLSVYDDYFVYVGGASTRSNFAPVADELGLNYEETKYFVFGQNNSWYRHFHHLGYCHDDTSDNFDDNYPEFRQQCLMQRKKSTCPQTVALGVGEFFFADQKQRRWKFNLEHTTFLKTCFGGEAGYVRIKRMWLGLGQSLVCLDYHRAKLHCYNVSQAPNNAYPGLKSALDKHVMLNRKVKAIAMSLTDQNCWLAAWKHDHAHEVGKGNIDPVQFLGWCRINQNSRSAKEVIEDSEDTQKTLITNGDKLTLPKMIENATLIMDIDKLTLKEITGK